MKRIDCLKILAPMIQNELVVVTLGVTKHEWEMINPRDGNCYLSGKSNASIIRHYLKRDKGIVYTVSNYRFSVISTAWFGTSMSARRILGLESVPRVGLFAH